MRGKRKKTEYEFAPSTSKCKKGCIYWRSLAAKGGDKACHYFLDVGRLRACEPSVCDKYCTSRKRRTKQILDRRSRWTHGAYTLRARVHTRAVYR